MKHTRTDRIVVIGGGVGGLTTALLLAHKGYDVHVVEAQRHWGGRLRFVHCDGDRIDAGPTIVLLPDVLRRILHTCGICDVRMQACDPLVRMHFADGTTCARRADPQAMIEEMTQFAPEAGAQYARYIAQMEQRYAWGVANVLDQTFTNYSWREPARLFAQLARFGAMRSVHADCARFFSDARLHDAFGLQSLYIGGNPYTTPAMYALIGYAELAYGISYVEGGYASLVPRLVAAAQQYGVRMEHRTIERIAWTARGRVCAVTHAQGSIPCEAVVYSGEMHRLAPLLGMRARRRWQPSSGCFLLYIGIEGTYPDRDVHAFWLCAQFAQHMREVFRTGTLPTDPAVYTFYPSRIDRSLTKHPDDSVLYVLVPVPSGSTIHWADVQQSFAARIVRMLERRAFPKLSQRTRWMQMRTPADAAAEGLFAGGAFGLAPTWTQTAMFRPQLRPYPHMDGLYAVGASVHPGGGIPIVMKGAEMLVRSVF